MNASPLRRRAFKALERRVARRVQMVGAVSDSEAHLAREVVSAPRVRVVPNGIPELDPDRAPGASATRSAGVVAMGRVVPQRQPGAVAAILADVADLAPVVWLGGVKKAPGSLEELARARVPVTGWLPREEALDRLGEASVYLHWTAWDGMPLSILEAMARDVVVIASDIAPNRSILGPRQVFASQAEAISAIRRVLVDEPYRESLLREQRVRRGQYGSTAMMLGWEELYAALTGEVNSPGPDNNPPGRQPCAIADEFAVARVSRRARLTTGGLHRV